MIRAAIHGVGVWGPGLAGWDQARAVLTGAVPWQADHAAPPMPPLLAPAERRRAGAAIRLALTVAAEASAAAGLAPGAIAGVFATSNGDGAVLGALLETLASAAPFVSPTQFHNSVHNAAAGYWSIATRSHAPVTCLSGHDGSFAAGLLRAVAEVCSVGSPVLLVAYDLPMPEPLRALRGTTAAFGTALVLAPVSARPVAPQGGICGPIGPALAEIGLAFVAAPAIPRLASPRRSGLQDLATANPAARSLRLLEALAAGRAEQVSLALFDGRVDLEVRPCSTPDASAR